MATFAELVSSRRDWLEQVLKPWCRQAQRKDLALAEQEWADIAGKVDLDKTLWFWAWSRFPELVNDDLSSIDEARQVAVKLRDGREYAGFPDARRSKAGQLILVGRDPAHPRRFIETPLISLDEIAGVKSLRDEGRELKV